MAKALNVLFLSSEVYPFSKESALGDVSFSLPLALRDLGNDIRVMVPKYGNISERKNKIHEINRLKNLPLKVGDVEELATVKSSAINNPRSKVQAYITTNFTYFDSRKGVYHDPKTWEFYKDNAERFIFFNKSVIETCMILSYFPDIIHCNDWQTALVPMMVKELFPKQFKKTKIVYTVHNFNRQGNFPLATLKQLNIDDKKILENFTHKRQMNFLKGGLHYADFITTVSPTYAKDVLKDKNLSNGLDSILKDKAGNYKGVLNKIDPYIWNAEKDNLIKAKYDGDFYEFKYHNKVALINKFGLEFEPSVPLIAMVSKIEEGKGFELLIEQADEIFKRDLQFVLLGQGETALKDKLQKISDKYPEKFKCIFGFDDELAHLAEAGSDLYLIIPQYEPTPLSYMYSCSYGSIPVVFPSGALAEVVQEIDVENEEGTSVIVKEYNGSALLDAIDRASEIYKNKDKLEILARNGMNEDFSWKETAKEYFEIYKKLNKEA